jgi:hypothetical protein
METSSRIADQLVSGLRYDKWMSLMGRLVGTTPATAFTTKHLAHAVVWRQVLAVMICSANLNDRVVLTVVWNADWPGSWLDVLETNLRDIPFEFFKWPAWYVSAYRAVLKYSLLVKLLAAIVWRVCQRGISAKGAAKDFKVFAEFIEPARLKGTPHDADYWVDRENIKADEILFFLTEEQERVLLRDGYKLKSVLRDAQEQGYQIRRLRELPYSTDFLRNLWSNLIALIHGLPAREWSPTGSEFYRASCEYLRYASLFTNYRGKSLVYPRFPNGNATWRFNNAILTSLCRAYGVKSVGCQTRVQYANEFEFLFDCYDIFLVWGPAWVDFLGEGTRFVDRTIPVGCIYLDNAYSNGKTSLPRNETSSSISVTVFTGDLGGSHFTLGYSLSFVKHCVRLARKYPYCHFRVKTKEPEHVATILADEEFRSLYTGLEGSFVFWERARHDYFEILDSSDIVLAIGFTSPGAEAALLGKRVIYYTELKTGGEVFRQLPDFIAHNGDELTELFDIAVKDYQEYARLNSNKLDSLDPFRDGLARKRIAEVLVA